MRYNGQPLEKPKPRIIPLLREPEIRVTKNPDGTESTETIDRTIYIQASVLLDYDEFDEMCPAPEAPEVKKDGQAPFLNYNDPNYRLALEDHNRKRLDWIFLKSVAGTPGLEWDTVDLKDPATWENYSTELREAGFTPVQVKKLIEEVYLLQAIDEDRVEEARKSFLATQARVTGK